MTNAITSSAPLSGEILPPEDEVDETGFNAAARPLCPFCSARWTDKMMDVYIEEGDGGCPTCGPDPATVTIDITCEACDRLIYRKEGRSYEW